MDADPGRSGGEPVSIRAFRDTDMPRVLAIERASFSTPWKESTFRSLLMRTDTDLFVAERGGVPVGYAACWTVVDQAELGNVAVAPEARGLGIGGALVDHAIRCARSRGAREVFLEVRESNVSAQSVYLAKGFQVLGRRRRYYTLPTEDALVMRLEA
ncbi:MAG TPA: ribosomal protein S18-alanine N-acetyltransferase [Longimicrobiaceae bacterium]|nr:ribosomal protein S18-alanine N-acetyltransferase [Longimicrobiaceae bacterium]